MRNVLFLDIAKWFSHIIFHWTVVYRPVKPTPISPHKLPQWARQRAQRCSLRIGQLEPLQPRQMVQFASRARYLDDEYWWFVHICSNCNIFISLYTNLEKMRKQFSWDDVIKDSAACCALTCATCACVAAACHAPWMVSKVVCCKCASQQAMPTVRLSLASLPLKEISNKKTHKKALTRRTSNDRPQGIQSGNEWIIWNFKTSPNSLPALLLLVLLQLLLPLQRQL